VAEENKDVIAAMAMMRIGVCVLIDGGRPVEWCSHDVRDAYEKRIAEQQQEIGRMAALPMHENVVRLFCVVELANEDVGAVVEYCAQGALVDARRRAIYHPTNCCRLPTTQRVA
jgi:hypothetical protein